MQDDVFTEVPFKLLLLEFALVLELGWESPTVNPACNCCVCGLLMCAVITPHKTSMSSHTCRFFSENRDFIFLSPLEASLKRQLGAGDAVGGGAPAGLSVLI